ncbi:hypothetical protein SKAU_G00100860 [Synaphobranchus kaupii]|uniref:Uncharacterized protein n=1 Tax=Synaphobranchus kaupii TaxID=118154 RepID=A0A9Q1FYD1_SYNKA|nr:hypothetical protein SKAU_G00100860 [Synaphobranchus kaupii]
MSEATLPDLWDWRSTIRRAHWSHREEDAVNDPSPTERGSLLAHPHTRTRVEREIKLFLGRSARRESGSAGFSPSIPSFHLMIGWCHGEGFCWTRGAGSSDSFTRGTPHPTRDDTAGVVGDAGSAGSPEPYVI